MLKSLTIKNFKSFKDTTLELSPFTLMIGANASGKTNAIEALVMTNWLARGVEVNDLAGKIDQDLNFRGSNLSFFLDKTQYVSFEFGFFNQQQNTDSKLCYTLENDELELVISEENFFYKNELVYQKKMDKHKAGTLKRSESKRKYQVTITSDSTKWYTDSARTLQLYTANILHEISKPNTPENLIRERTQYALISLQSSFILDATPLKMRDYAPKKNINLQSHGQNLSAILYNLCQDESNKNRLLSLIKSIPEQNIEDITFIETSREDVMLQLVESFGNKTKTIDAPLLSDGTLRVLAISAFLLSAQVGSLVVIEEIDNGIHPARINNLLEQLYKIAKEREIQILMTSHNPALLDAIPNDCLEDVVCCYRDKEEGDSRFIRLGNLYQYPKLIAQGTLGELLTDGIIDRYVHDKRSPEEIKKEALNWLDDFKKELEEI